MNGGQIPQGLMVANVIQISTLVTEHFVCEHIGFASRPPSPICRPASETHVAHFQPITFSICNSISISGRRRQSHSQEYSRIRVLLLDMHLPNLMPSQTAATRAAVTCLAYRANVAAHYPDSGSMTPFAPTYYTVLSICTMYTCLARLNSTWLTSPPSFPCFVLPTQSRLAMSHEHC